MSALLVAAPVCAVTPVLAGPFGLSAEQLAALAPQFDLLRSCPPEDEWRGFAGIDCPATTASKADQFVED